MSLFPVGLFADGFVVVGDSADRSAFCEGRNVFHDLVDRHHEAEHGRLVKFGVTQDGAGIIKTIELPEGAEPVLETDYQVQMNVEGGVGPKEVLGRRIGYRLGDQEVIEELA